MSKPSPVKKKIKEYTKKIVYFDNSLADLAQNKKEARKNGNEKEVQFYGVQIAIRQAARQATYQALKDFEDLLYALDTEAK